MGPRVEAFTHHFCAIAIPLRRSVVENPSLLCERILSEQHKVMEEKMDWIIVEAIAESAAALAAVVAIGMSLHLHRRQLLLSRRQLLLPLWEHLKDLSRIDPASPVWPDVVRAVNTLELIAICWEGQLIDRDIVRRMYRDLYLEFYEEIQLCGQPPAQIGKNGREMLRECPAATRLYGILHTESAESGTLAEM